MPVRNLNGSGAQFVRNAWYVAAWSDELAAGQAARLHAAGRARGAVSAGQRHPRGARGPVRPPQPAALAGARARRRDRVRLSWAAIRLRGCLRAHPRPTHDTGARARAQLSRGRAGPAASWCGWAMRPAPTPPRSPEFPWMSKPGWQQTKLHAHIECNYQLVIDNLLDLSHLAFVHASTVGSRELADDAVVKTTRSDSGRADEPLDARRGAGADLRAIRTLRRQHRPLADHRFSRSGHRGYPQRFGQGRHRRARGTRRRAAVGIHRLPRHHAGDRPHDELLLGGHP